MLSISGEALVGCGIHETVDWSIYLCARTEDATAATKPPGSCPFYAPTMEREGDLADGKAEFSFVVNDVSVTVRSDSDRDLIYRDYSRAIRGYIGENVGPYPNPVLTEEEEANDARIAAENERRWQEKRERMGVAEE